MHWRKAFAAYSSSHLPFNANAQKSIKDLPEQLTSRLYQFQRDCVDFGLKNYGRVLIGDEMGVGKTVQSLVLAYCFRSKWPLLIICPSSLVSRPAEPEPAFAPTALPPAKAGRSPQQSLYQRRPFISGGPLARGCWVAGAFLPPHICIWVAALRARGSTGRTRR